MAATEEIASWRGYNQGMQDAKPPRLVEEHRQLHPPSRQPEPNMWSAACNYSSGERPKRWWHR